MTFAPGARAQTVPPPSSGEPSTSASDLEEALDLEQRPDDRSLSIDLEATQFVPEPYLLGPGDRLRIEVFEEPQFNAGDGGIQTVLSDGTIYLPLIGTLYVTELSLDETTELITHQLRNLLKRPIVSVSLADARPLKIAVIGEVNRPGAYAVSSERQGTVVEGRTLGARTLGIPSVTEAIRLAGGITDTAQIRQVQILRAQGTRRERLIELDLWALLQSGDTAQDIALRDGDTIVVPRALSLTPAEVTELAEASFAPDEIQVQVVGEVVNPGAVTLVPNSTLNQAILTAGGFDQKRARKADVLLVRLNPDGTVTKREIPVDFETDLDPENNPAMRNEDVIIVRRSGLAATTDTIATVLDPFARILNAVVGLDRLID
ncbi:polysaccharide biosynthesis/export family protein [Rubidibacter lacunae]|uniref:polysaccharide biosynthesis/export family protein n=1 Tax=Rubidibacter lacunae TaxID=582514 RepID=UPI0018DBC6BE|nr:polysaccharide biosynthesis/export family protein [Rubidibacter lacunae]